MYSLTLCSTDFIWCTETLSQGRWRKVWERSYPLCPRAMEGVSTGSSISHTLLAAGFLFHTCLLPALALTSLVRCQSGYLNGEKTNLTVNPILSCQTGELKQSGRGARAQARQGGKACGWENGHGMQRQEEAEEAGCPPLNSFQLSCATSPCDTEHWLHSSSISSFVN